MLEPPDTPVVKDLGYYFENIEKAGYPVGGAESWQIIDVIKI